MKKALLPFLFLFVSNCGLNWDCTPAKTEFKIIPYNEILNINDSIQNLITYEYQESKNFTLFQYTHSAEQCKEASDDEYYEVFAFQINKDVNKFEIIDSDIVQTKFFYIQRGAWANQVKKTARKGIIKGRKISDKKWSIEVNVLTDSISEYMPSRKINIKGTYLK